MALEHSLSTPALMRAAGARRSRYRYVIAGLTMLYHFTFGLSIFVVSPLAPLIIEEYGVNRSSASLLIGSVLLLQAAMAIPGGMLGSRFPLKWVIALGWLAVSTTMFSFAAPNFATLLALRIVYGIASSLVFPNVGPLVMQWFPHKEIPLVNALNAASISLGMAASTFAAGPLAEALGWRATLSLFGVPSLFGALVWIALGRTRPEEAQATVASSAEERRPGHGSGAFLANLQLLKSRPVLLMAFGNAAAVAQYVALTAWLPTFYHEVYSMSLSRAAALLGVLPLVGVVSLLSAGLLSTRIRARRPFLLAPGVLLGFAGFGAVLLGGSALVLPALILVGFCTWFYQPILFAMPMELPGVTPRNVSVIFGLFMLVGGVTGFLSPLLVGAAADLTGTYPWGFGFLAVLSWGLALAAWKLPETGT